MGITCYLGGTRTVPVALKLLYNNNASGVNSILSFKFGPWVLCIVYCAVLYRYSIA
jgi:hypothetical protein